MFYLLDTPLDLAAVRAQLGRTDAGGYVSFEGWVRRRNEGREVTGLEYQAYAPMARREGERILADAAQRYDILAAAAAHRVGVLALGDVAVWIGVVAEHRGPAFEACRFIIDHIKERVPMWKLEYYADGTREWVGCHHCAQHSAHRHAHDAGQPHLHPAAPLPPALPSAPAKGFTAHDHH